MLIFQQIRNVIFSKKYLLYTNIGISVTLSGIGDILEQKYEKIKSEENRCFDIKRMENMALTGLPSGILCHYWYNFLDKCISGKTIRSVFKKVLMDQIIFSPIYISVFFITIGLLEKSNYNLIKEEIINKGYKLYFVEWIIWPPAQLINFYYLPTKYRVLYDNSISLVYDIYTSYVKHET